MNCRSLYFQSIKIISIIQINTTLKSESEVIAPSHHKMASNTQPMHKLTHAHILLSFRIIVSLYFLESQVKNHFFFEIH